MEPLSKTGNRDGNAVAELWAPAWFALLTALYFLWFYADHPIWTDGWRLYDLSQTVFGDFYRASVRGTFADASLQSADFPPLWPTIVALVDRATGLGPQALYIAAFLGFAGFAVVSEMVGRRLSGMPWIGLAAAAVILSAGPFQYELFGGQTTPIQLLLMSGILLALLSRSPLGPGRALAIGLLAGVTFLARFDALPFAAALILMLVVLEWRVGTAFLLLAGFVVAASPWITYSLAEFGTLFASDNKAVALAAVATHASEWHPTPLPTLFDDPAGWIAKIVRFGGRLALGIVWAFAGIALVPLVGAAAMLGGQAIRRGRVIGPIRFERTANWVRACVFGLALAAAASAQLLTGYGYQPRYFSVHVWFVIVVAMSLALASVREERRGAASQLLLVLIAIATAAQAVMLLPSAAREWHAGEAAFAFAPADYGAPDRGLLACLAGEPGATMFLDSGRAARFGALTRRRSVASPINIGALDATDLATFIDIYGVETVVLTGKAEDEAIVARLPPNRRLDCPEPVLALTEAGG